MMFWKKKGKRKPMKGRLADVYRELDKRIENLSHQMSCGAAGHDFAFMEWDDIVTGFKCTRCDFVYYQGTDSLSPEEQELFDAG